MTATFLRRPRVSAFGLCGILLMLVICLTAFGLVSLASAGREPFFYVKKQMVWLVLGAIPALIVGSRIPADLQRRAAPWLGMGSALSLVAVLLIGHRAGGSQRWLELGPVRVQPSEFVKFALPSLLAWWLAKRPLRIGTLRHGFWPPVGMIAVFLVLLIFQPDLGATALLGLVAGLVLFIAGVSPRALGVSGLLLALLLGGYIRLDPVRWHRVQDWRKPPNLEKPDQQDMARVAFMSGGAGPIRLGRGIENVPEAHTDFILTVVGEELGIAGSITVLLLFGGFLGCGLTIAARTANLYEKLLAFGLTQMITLQTMLNVAMASGILPPKGITLPFFSAGGSSLVTTFWMVGVLLQIGERAESDALPAQSGW